MTDFAALLRVDHGEAAVPLHLVDKAGLDGWLAIRSERDRVTLAAQGFVAAEHSRAILAGEQPQGIEIVLGVVDSKALGPWCLAKASETLAPGTYRIVDTFPGASALGWLLGQHRFTRYKAGEDKGPRILLTSDDAAIPDQIAIASAVALVRDLVDTPAADMGPQQLEEVGAALAAEFDAALAVTRGDALDRGYPMIAAVGRAAHPAYAPRMIELVWGESDHPRVAIIGKGVSFDSGGLDIKPSSGMRLMKKDMGGAAHAFALARLVMAARLPVRLHLLVPAAENAIAGDAFRPGDVLRSRAGITVEVHNTDAEGRLLLADALTRAGEEDPELIIDYATLTGAARVALGPDLPALFANDDALAADILVAGVAVGDPCWRLPLWPGYHDHLKSEVADMANAGDSPFAGAISAALFLQRFVPADTPWAHLDTFAWMPADKPGRPKGGAALGLRAAWALLRSRYAFAH